MANRISRKTASRIGLMAFEVIDHAYQRSSNGPIEGTTVEKLALGYLVVAGLTTPSNVKTIWEILRHEGAFWQPSCRAAYYGPVIVEIKHRAQKLGTNPLA